MGETKLGNFVQRLPRLSNLQDSAGTLRNSGEVLLVHTNGGRAERGNKEVVRSGTSVPAGILPAPRGPGAGGGGGGGKSGPGRAGRSKKEVVRRVCNAKDPGRL
jgi:hypothetical protein